MADIIDQAQEQAERILQAELNAQRAAGPEACLLYTSDAADEHRDV